MDLRQLKYFVSVVDHQGFTKAAGALRIAQPALGSQIKKLEDELSVKLIDRHSRGSVPTEAGLVLLERARAILNQVDSAEVTLKNLTQVAAGRVVIGMAPSASAILAYSLIEAAARRYPKIKLVIVEDITSVLTEWLASRRLDIAIVYDSVRSAVLTGDPLLVESLYLVQAPGNRISANGEIPFRQLENYPLIWPVAPHQLCSALKHHASEVGITLDIQFEVQSVHVMKQLVEQGIGAAIMPYGAVHRECAEGRLFAQKIVDPDVRRIAHLAYMADHPRSNAEKLIVELIHELLGETAPPKGEYWKPASVSLAS